MTVGRLRDGSLVPFGSRNKLIITSLLKVKLVNASFEKWCVKTYVSLHAIFIVFYNMPNGFLMFFHYNRLKNCLCVTYLVVNHGDGFGVSVNVN
jgi:hypothetical protein